MSRTCVFTVGWPMPTLLRALGHGTGQEACPLCSLDSLGSLGGPEFRVDVFDVRFHGGTADAELVADRGKRPIAREEDQDAGLGRRQGNRLSGLFLAGRLRLIGNRAMTVRRGLSIRHRPKRLNRK
jgi:hypothetical protein